MKIGICNGFIIVLNAFVRADILGLKAWKKVTCYCIFTSKRNWLLSWYICLCALWHVDKWNKKWINWSFVRFVFVIKMAYTWNLFVRNISFSKNLWINLFLCNFEEIIFSTSVALKKNVSLSLSAGRNPIDFIKKAFLLYPKRRNRQFQERRIETM